MNFSDGYQISVLLIISVLQVIKFMQNFDQPLNLSSAISLTVGYLILV